MSGPKAAVAIVAIVVIGLVVVLATASSDPDRAVSSPLVGRVAPAITATDTAGRPVDLRRYAGSFVVVNFFATWCAPCVAEHPELVRFASVHDVTGDAKVVSVAYNEDPAVVTAFFQRQGGDWPVVAAGRENFALEYGVVKLPETYLVGPDSVVVEKFDGGVTAAALDEAIARVTSRSSTSTGVGR